jgi:deazaflavin-dependent oxidoreductase (nitroreductase family)
MSDLATYNQRIINEFRATGGRTGHSSPLLLLTATGAKSGKPRTSPLAYSRDGDRLVILASNARAHTHPVVMSPPRANPIVTVELVGERFEAAQVSSVGRSVRACLVNTRRSCQL